MSEEQPPTETPGRPSWRHRSWSLPVVVAVALVAVVLGGLGGAALASVGGHDDRRGPGFGRMGGPGIGPGGPPGGQGHHWRFSDPYRHGQGDPRLRSPDDSTRPGFPASPSPSP